MRYNLMILHYKWLVWRGKVSKIDELYPEVIEELNLMQQYDKDKELSRKRWFKGATGRFRKQIPVKYALNPYDRTYTLICPFWGHIGPHYGTCEEFDMRIDQEIMEARGK